MNWIEWIIAYTMAGMLVHYLACAFFFSVGDEQRARIGIERWYVLIWLWPVTLYCFIAGMIMAVIKR